MGCREAKDWGSGGHVPTPVPRSSELSTRIDRSGLTLPMICTALPLERWASCTGWDVSISVDWVRSEQGKKRYETCMTVVQDLGFGMARKLEEIITYTIQVGGDVAVRINDCSLTSKLDNPADNYDIVALVRVEVGRGDSRCRLGLHAD